MAFWHKWFSTDQAQETTGRDEFLERFINDSPEVEEPKTEITNSVAFSVGMACSKKHASPYSDHPVTLATPLICSKCGGNCRLAVIKETFTVKSGWSLYYDTEREFVRWLKKPTGK